MGFRRRIRTGGGGGAAVTAEYQAILAYATTQGFTKPSAGNQTQQNALIIAMKAAGVWDNLDLFYNFVTDGDASFAKINWKAPGTFQAVSNAGIAFTTLNGFKGDATTGVITTGYNTPGTQMTPTNFGYFLDVEVNAIGVTDPGYVLATTTLSVFLDAAGGFTNLGTAQGNTIQMPSDGIGFMSMNVVGDVRYGAEDGVVVSQNNFGGGAPNLVSPDGLQLLRAIGFASSNSRVKCFGIGANFNTKEGALYAAWSAYIYSAITLEAEYQAIITYATTNALALPSFGTRVKQNQLIKDLKAAAIWADLDQYLVFANNASLGFSMINWKNPGTFNAIPVGGVIQVASGVRFPALADYINLNFIPSVNGVKYASGDASFFIDNVQPDLSGNSNFGSKGAASAGYTWLYFKSGGNTDGVISQSADVVDAAPGIATGLFHVSGAAGNLKLWRQGIQRATIATTFTTRTPATLHLNGFNDNGVHNDGSNFNQTFAGFGIGASLVGKELQYAKLWKKYFDSVSVGPSLRAQYMLILLVALTNGIAIPDPPTQQRQSDFVGALVDGGIWNQLDALWVTKAASPELACLNWKDPLSHLITQHGTIPFTQYEGFQGDGVTGYLNLHWNPSVDGVHYQTDDCSILFASSTNANLGINDRPIGAWDLTRAIQLVPRHGADQASYSVNDGTFVPSTGTVPDSSGIFQVQRTNGAATELFQNGSLVGATLAPSLGLPTVDVYAGAINFNGAASLFSSRNIGLIAFGSAMDGLEAQIAAAWNNFIAP